MPQDISQPTFTKAQLSKYFEHIQLPQKYRGDDVPRDLSLLTALHIHQIAAIPYENLSLHYSKHKTIDLEPHFLYTKFVEDGRNRGGYCMEGSLFFLHILRSLGFDVYPTGVRIRLRENGVPKGDYVGLTHVVLIIELKPLSDGQEAEKYACDVAFGGDGPTVPMPLKTGVVTRNLGTQEIRFAQEFLPMSRKHKFWIYQYRNGPEKPWNSFYVFNETEFLDPDFNVISYWTSQAPTFQKTTVIIVKFVLKKGDHADAENKIAGKLMLVNGTVKRNMGGKTEVVEECSNEPQRLKALENWFDITLTEEEISGIKGYVTELRDVEVLA
ncbi:Arylamine N-acetyltransferase [Cytospora mali]|uniref:Arylamine N-acetyltransferase n=1 Tax=Cytospora mali TaxID=578113 RepID=A0A194V5F8_CYTMA|nr:Arylamine N-acetyltransferase [Valsa mali var. pyri (nom. inval.)]